MTTPGTTAANTSSLVGLPGNCGALSHGNAPLFHSRTSGYRGDGVTSRAFAGVHSSGAFTSPSNSPGASVSGAFPEFPCAVGGLSPA